MKDLLAIFEKTQWLEQIAALLTIVAIPYAFLRLVIYKAKHKIKFQPDETYHEVIVADHPQRPLSLWLQLMVRNSGFEVSKNAEAYIANVWNIEKDLVVKLSAFRAPVKLKWSHEGKIAPVDILPRSSRRLDVCFICQNEEILHLMAEGFPSGTIKNELPPSEYVFEIVVVSDNSLRPARFLFRIIWDGVWKNLTGQNYVKNFHLAKAPTKSFVLY